MTRHAKHLAVIAAAAICAAGGTACRSEDGPAGVVQVEAGARAPTGAPGAPAASAAPRCLTKPVRAARPAGEVTPRLAPLGVHRTLYMNRWGGTYTPVTYGDDSTNNLSTVPDVESTVPPWPHSDTDWSALVACVRDKYARFDVLVTDTDPSPLPHIEAVVGGAASSVGLPAGIGGVSPFADDCSVIEKAIVFIFPLEYAGDMVAICETAAHEPGHALGLDHEYWCPDIMTYIPGCHPKTFDDALVACGEDTERPCQCTDQQNSARHLFAVLGGNPADTTPPTIEIGSPSAGAEVPAGSRVEVSPADDVGIARVELIIDGVVAEGRDAPPWTLAMGKQLSPGAHALEARATDFAGLQGSDVVNVNVVPCASGGCPGGQLCNDLGACMVVVTGIGEACDDGADCASGMCGDDGERKLCTEPCDLVGSICPPGFRCRQGSAGGGLCWPTNIGPYFGGGCALARPGEGSPLAPLAPLAPLGLLLALTTRARTRARRAGAGQERGLRR